MNEPLLKFVREYWFIMIFFGSLIIGWTTFQSNIAQLVTRMEKMEVRSDANVIAVADVNVRLAEIQTTLEFIKQQIAKK